MSPRRLQLTLLTFNLAEVGTAHGDGFKHEGTLGDLGSSVHDVNLVLADNEGLICAGQQTGVSHLVGGLEGLLPVG